ncbi:hypothetical protein GW17_00058806 [Ensete ventricosum]|nr:hypothetical protein GW17_00058806 [Ensete ventricosum]
MEVGRLDPHFGPKYGGREALPPSLPKAWSLKSQNLVSTRDMKVELDPHLHPRRGKEEPTSATHADHLDGKQKRRDRSAMDHRCTMKAWKVDPLLCPRHGGRETHPSPCLQSSLRSGVREARPPPLLEVWRLGNPTPSSSEVLEVGRLDPHLDPRCGEREALPLSLLKAWRLESQNPVSA